MAQILDKLQLTDPGKPMIELCQVYKSFGTLEVLKGIDLTLHEGKTTVVIGESGAGKSVILKHIVRLLRPDRGEVRYRGRRIDNLSDRHLVPIRSEFGFLFQLSALFDSMNVGDNVSFPLVHLAGKTKRQARDIAEEKLSMVGLAGIQGKWPSELSGGQKKRVALARAIALDPKVILYDEPTTGLDPPRSDTINELIIKLQRELKVTSVVVTHDLASARKVADRIVMLYRGHLIFDGSPLTINTAQEPIVRQFVEGRATDEELASLKISR